MVGVWTPCHDHAQRAAIAGRSPRPTHGYFASTASAPPIAEEAQDQRQGKPVSKYGECQVSGCREQCTYNEEPVTTDAVGGARQERHRDGITGKVDTANPTGFTCIKRPGGGDLMECRREGHLRR